MRNVLVCTPFKVASTSIVQTLRNDSSLNVIKHHSTEFIEQFEFSDNDVLIVGCRHPARLRLSAFFQDITCPHHLNRPMDQIVNCMSSDMVHQAFVATDWSKLPIAHVPAYIDCLHRCMNVDVLARRWAPMQPFRLYNGTSRAGRRVHVLFYKYEQLDTRIFRRMCIAVRIRPPARLLWRNITMDKPTGAIYRDVLQLYDDKLTDSDRAWYDIVYTF